MPDDYYVSKYSGEEIDALLGGAGAGNVRYDAAQTLTDAQKTQARGNISAMQGIESTDHPGCYYVLNGSAVEWINPPMQVGVEYRTTERYLGKPVYTQIINCGSMPDIGSQKDISIDAFNVDVVTFISGWCTYYGSVIEPDFLGMALSANNSNIRIANLTREVNSSAVIYTLFKYTKKTD